MKAYITFSLVILCTFLSFSVECQESTENESCMTECMPSPYNSSQMSLMSSSNGACGYNLRVSIHLLRKTDGTGGLDQYITPNQLGTSLEIYSNKIVEDLNESFDWETYPEETYNWMSDAPYGSAENGLSSTFPSDKIQFELMSADYVDNDAMYFNNQDRRDAAPSECNKAIHIVLGGVDGAIGIDYGYVSGVAVIAAEGGGASAIAHEMGHQLGLFHTFSNTNYYRASNDFTDVGTVDQLSSQGGSAIADTGRASSVVDIDNGIISGENCDDPTDNVGDDVCDTFVISRPISYYYNGEDNDNLRLDRYNPYLPNETIFTQNDDVYFDELEDTQYFPIFDDVHAKRQVTNFMGYNTGKDHFTPGQYQKMLNTIDALDRLIAASCPIPEFDIVASINCVPELTEINVTWLNGQQFNNAGYDIFANCEECDPNEQPFNYSYTFTDIPVNEMTEDGFTFIDEAYNTLYRKEFNPRSEEVHTCGLFGPRTISYLDVEFNDEIPPISTQFTLDENNCGETGLATISWTYNKSPSTFQSLNWYDFNGQNVMTLDSETFPFPQEISNLELGNYFYTLEYLAGNDLICASGLVEITAPSFAIEVTENNSCLNEGFAPESAPSISVSSSIDGGLQSDYYPLIVRINNDVDPNVPLYINILIAPGQTLDIPFVSNYVGGTLSVQAMNGCVQEQELTDLLNFDFQPEDLSIFGTGCPLTNNEILFQLTSEVEITNSIWTNNTTSVTDSGPIGGPFYVLDDIDLLVENNEGCAYSFPVFAGLIPQISPDFVQFEMYSCETEPCSGTITITNSEEYNALTSFWGGTTSSNTTTDPFTINNVCEGDEFTFNTNINGCYISNSISIEDLSNLECNECLCQGDLNLDGGVDVLDLTLFTSMFGQACGDFDQICLCADFNGDNVITSNDLSLFLSIYGTFCEE